MPLLAPVTRTTFGDAIAAVVYALSFLNRLMVLRGWKELSCFDSNLTFSILHAISFNVLYPDPHVEGRACFSLNPMLKDSYPLDSSVEIGNKALVSPSSQEADH